MSKHLKVAICAYRPSASRQEYDLEKNVEDALGMIRMAATEGADLAVLPETFAVLNAPNWMSEAQPLDGYVVSRLAGEANRLNIGIAAGQPTSEDGRSYNSVVLMGRDGEIAAVYHKSYPTIGELEGGIHPGSGPVVADTEFGRVGFAVCFDLNFAELRLAYRDLAPDLILFCSAFRGGRQTEWWGYETRSYIVSSCIDPRSVIVNPLGRCVAETDSWVRFVTRTINLDYAVVHYDYNNHNLDDARLRYGSEFVFEHSEPEGVMLVSAAGSMSTRSLIDAMGWEEVEDYFSRARRIRQDAADGLPIDAGPSAW